MGQGWSAQPGRASPHAGDPGPVRRRAPVQYAARSRNSTLTCDYLVGLVKRAAHGRGRAPLAPARRPAPALPAPLDLPRAGFSRARSVARL